MTLFWHDFFGTSNVTVKSGPLMRGHLRLLRANALGSFEALLDGVSKDPATLLALDAAANRKVRPSVHFARSLMEHFTLGPGNFTETDAAEAARAFTGLFVLRGELRHFPREVDSGPKRILGEEGNFSREDVVRILLRQRATARLVVRRLYRAFVSETAEPSEAIVSPLAESFDKDHDIGKLVEAILRSNLFFSEAAYRQRIKSPVDFALGIVKALEGSVPTAQLSRDLAALGMNLCHPPTVEGWQGGRSWITWSTIVGRSNLAKALLCGDEPYGKVLDPLGIARKNGRGAPESAAEFLVDLFLQGDIEDGVRRALLGSLGAGGDPQEPLRAFTHLLTALPEFHLA